MSNIRTRLDRLDEAFAPPPQSTRYFFGTSRAKAEQVAIEAREQGFSGPAILIHWKKNSADVERA